MSLNLQRFKKAAERSANSEAHQSLGRIYKTLETRTLGDKHFRQILAALETILDEPGQHLVKKELVDGSDTSLCLRDRSIMAWNIYLSAFANKLNMVVPVTTIYQFNSHSAIVHCRSLPVRLKYGHIENRYEERLGRKVCYQSGNTMFNIAFGLMLAKAAEEKILSGEQDTVPVLIPHNDGLFVGKVEPVENPWNHGLIHDRSYYIMHDDKTLWNVIGGHWIPQCETRFYTFIDKSLFTPVQRQMHDVLMKYMEDPDLITGMDHTIKDYMSAKKDGVFMCDDRKINHVINQLRADIENPMMLEACSTRSVHKPSQSGSLQP